MSYHSCGKSRISEMKMKMFCLKITRYSGISYICLIDFSKPVPKEGLKLSFAFKLLVKACDRITFLRE